MTKHYAINSVDSASIELSRAMNESKEPPRVEPYICKIFLFGVWLLRTFKSIRQIKK